MFICDCGGRACRRCLMLTRAEHLYAVMLAETVGQRPGADAPHLSFALLPPDVQRGWLAVAEAAGTIGR